MTVSHRVFLGRRREIVRILGLEHPAADRTGSWPEPPGETLIDDDDSRSRRGVAVGKGAATASVAMPSVSK